MMPFLPESASANMDNTLSLSLMISFVAGVTPPFKTPYNRAP